MDPSNNTDTEEETIALRKKRSRRVSFADNEITAVHFFKRDDEDSETPSESKTSSDSDGKQIHNDVLGFFSDLAGDDDFLLSSPSRNGGGDGYEDEDEDYVRKSFLNPVGSPSPGSSFAGSAVSTDDEANFLGPVSAGFIRPGQLSDSAASDDKHDHDLTMDSTAFSLHYRSLAMSDSGDLKTPTRFGLPLEEKTASQNSSPFATGSLMVLTKAKKQSSRSSVPIDATSDGRDSNDMSIVGDNPHKYDYGAISPRLAAILTEGSKDLSPTSSNSPKETKVYGIHQNGNGYQHLKNTAELEMCNINTDDMSVELVPMAPTKLGEANQYPDSTSIDRVMLDSLSNNIVSPIADASVNHQVQTPTHLVKGNKEFRKEAIELGQQQLDLHAGKSGSPQQVDEVLKLDVSAALPRYHHSSEGHQKESYIKDVGLMFDQQCGSPIQGSISSLSAKRKQLFRISPDSSNRTGTVTVTPSSKQPVSLMFEDYVKHGDKVSSIQKSISKFKIIDPSPCASSLKEGIDRLKCKLLHYSPESSLFNSKDYEHKNMDTPLAPIDEQLSSAHLQNEGHKSLIKMDANGTQSPKSIGKLSQNEETVDPREDQVYLYCMSSDILYRNKHIKSVTEVASPSQLTQLGREVTHLALVDDHEKLESTTLVSDKFASSLGAIEYESSLFGELKQQNQLKEPVSIGSGDGDMFESISSELNTNMAPYKSDSFVFGRRDTSSLPFEITKVSNFAQSPSKRNLVQSPARRKPIPSASAEKLIRSPAQEQSSLSRSILKSLSESYNHDMKTLAGKGVLSPKSNSNGLVNNKLCLQLQGYHSPFSNRDIEISSGQKRKSVLVLGDGNQLDKIAKIQRSPEVHKSMDHDLIFSSEHSDEIRTGREKDGDHTTRKNWTDILVKLAGVTEQLLSPLSNKLNLSLLRMLEDIADHLLKVKKCDILCSEIQSQEMADPLSSLMNKRVAEARLLLYNIVYQRAKLQLMHMKREKLQKKVQLVSSRVQESQMLMLKLKCIPYSSEGDSTNSQANDVHFQSDLLDSEGKHEVTPDKVTTTKQKLQELDGKTKNLSKFFLSYCKIRGDPSCSDTITLVHDYLKKRICCKCIRQYLQMWEVDDFQQKDGCYNVLLNYQGYISQRFIVNAGPVSSIIVSNKLNNMQIVKAFPNMDASIAFSSVFDSETTKKCIGSRCFAQETQISSSLLCNLLDVVGEVQLAWIEIRNLIQAKFISPSVEKLDLQLSFIDFCSGQKVKVTLDMTCLKCGVYPLDILPSQIYDPASGECKSLPQSLVARVRNATEDTGVGYSRIKKLCMCISEAIQTSTSTEDNLTEVGLPKHSAEDRLIGSQQETRSYPVKCNWICGPFFDCKYVMKDLKTPWI
ncbi:Dentin sialoprotein [Quillaja saponaria]|uniref:Dentin sialoprotein n=1 Tax=Quillaja saponaria TaxID=32244 RepID=A0AAD7PLJ2_QUISA|nr:Dentin sialoprotein [Quillaja saponaria]